MSHHVSAQAAREADDKTLLGFWIYIMTDCVLFASLFAVYAVQHAATFGGPGGHDLFDANYVLIETFALLTSSFTCGIALLAAQRKRRDLTLLWLAVTFGLGALFIGMELHEFSQLVAEGNSWRRSGFLSAFFTLVSTHGLHISVGLLWMAALMIKIWRRGFGRSTLRRLALFSMFWHFLDLVWIFIFTVVYMLGVA